MGKSNNPAYKSEIETHPISRRNVIQAAGAGGAVSLAGCIGGNDSEGITVGFLGPLQLDAGVGGRRSAEIAVEELNEQGGILDQELELISADSNATPSDARTEAESLIFDEGIDVLFGGYVSEVALGIADTVANANVPWFVTGAGTPRLVTENHGEDYEKYKNIFRVMSGNSDLQAEAQADYAEFLANQHDIDSFAVVTENAAWTQSTADNMPSLLQDRGLNVAMEERVELDTTDFSPLLDSVEESGADVMIKEVGLMDVAGMLQTWGANEYPFAMEGLNLLSLGVEFWDDTNGNCEYETTGWFGGGGAVEITDKTGSFLDAYTSRHDSRPRVPVIMGLATYDAINLYAEVVETVGSADYEDNLDGMVEELQGINYTGVAGNIEFFPPDHQYPNDVMVGEDHLPFTMLQWQADDDGGTRQCVYPEQYITSEHVLPSWIN
jgi:branched-chain amino acid transport system substrate-binding protein